MKTMIENYSNRYEKTTEYNGVHSETEFVDNEHAKRFIDAVPFFESLGGNEVVSRSLDGVITVESTSPDRETVRTTVFTPLEEEE